jgi:hypothetical protein
MAAAQRAACAKRLLAPRPVPCQTAPPRLLAPLGQQLHTSAESNLTGVHGQDRGGRELGLARIDIGEVQAVVSNRVSAEGAMALIICPRWIWI